MRVAGAAWAWHPAPMWDHSLVALFLSSPCRAFLGIHINGSGHEQRVAAVCVSQGPLRALMCFLQNCRPHRSPGQCSHVGMPHALTTSYPTRCIPLAS